MRTSMGWVAAVVCSCGICACGATSGGGAITAKPLAARQRVAATSVAAPQRVHAPRAVPESDVATPLRLRALPVAMYCNGVGIRLTRCRPGQRPVVGVPQRLVELSLTARRATGLNRWYAWSLDAPASCSLSGGGEPTLGPVKAGSRLVFDDLFPPECRGTVRASVLYVVQAPDADAERATVVGRTTMRLP